MCYWHRKSPRPTPSIHSKCLLFHVCNQVPPPSPTPVLLITIRNKQWSLKNRLCSVSGASKQLELTALTFSTQKQSGFFLVMTMATHCKHSTFTSRPDLSLAQKPCQVSWVGGSKEPTIWFVRFCFVYGKDRATTHGVRVAHLAVHTTCSSTCDWTLCFLLFKGRCMKWQCIWHTLRIPCIGGLIKYGDWARSLPDMTWNVFLNPYHKS